MNRKTIFGILFILLLIDISILTINVQNVMAEGYTDVTVIEAKSMIDSNPSLVVLDVRTQGEYDSGHIRNAQLIPVTELPGRLDELNKTDEILVHCLSGGRSRTASQLLVDNGFLYVYNMLGGITSWIGEGYPVYVKYSSIQEAINNANEGDTIYVSSGTYYESVVVNKSLSLIGENRETTIIDGGSKDFATVVVVTANNVVFRGFAIRVEGLGSGHIFLDETVNTVIAGNNITGHDNGIGVNNSTNITLTGNNIIGCYLSIILTNSSHVSVTENNIEKFVYYRHSGIYLHNSFNNVVTGNNITEIGCGIDFIGSSNNTIAGNRITGYWDNFTRQYNGHGIRMIASSIKICSSYNIFSDNDIRNVSYAIAAFVYEGVEGHHNNVFLRNNITNSAGIYLRNSSSNTFYHNNFIDNKNQVISEGSTNIWDDGYPSGGNYWDNYDGTDLYLGPGQNITGSDGIGDTPYILDANNTDNYPLMEQYVQGNLSVSIYTDKDAYNAGDTIHLGLNITNPDSVKYQCFALLCELPDSSVYPVMHQHSVVLPIGLDYSNPSFKTFTLPNLPSGTYTWHVALLDRTTHTILVQNTAEWEFS